MMRPRHSKSPSPVKGKKEAKHWSQRLHETIVSAGPEGLLNLMVHGGAENGQFCYIGDICQDKINYHSGKLHHNEVVLEIQGQKVAGFTLRDLLEWLKHVSKNSQPVMFKTVKAGLLTKDLREYLNTRFQKNSVDHDLQQTIRDNVYRRTVPCTTRPQRSGELDGVDYKFLTVEEFMALEKSGNLLESGLYDGNHYGTPKPSKDPSDNPFRRTNSVGTLLPGQHPSSEGKRRRNRSNVEVSTNNRSSIARSPSDIQPPPLTRKKSLERAQSSSSLGPLPPSWEMAFTEDGVPYFIDHSTETTHWLDPRLAHNQKLNPLDCNDDELPYGWEKVEDSVYGTYYIDHVNRKTQYENPVIQAKRLAKEKQGGKTFDSGSTRELNGRGSPPSYESHRPVFTKNPAELRGKFIRTELLKSPRGFGFTIVGGEDSDTEFLQIKSVVPNGPAATDGNLQRGDVLVYVNSECVLGFTHQDVVNIFRTIPIGGKVALEICRGYPLPFDPDDPNTEIVTTVAVTMPKEMNTRSTPMYSNHSPSTEPMKRSACSLPDVASGINDAGSRNRSFEDIHNTDSVDSASRPTTKPQVLSINIVKGPMGFGFTIADSAYGQKVKHILDQPRCKNLQEGDILVEINRVKVKDMAHSDVVRVLKDCARGEEATVVIQRGGILTPSRARKHQDRSSPSKVLNDGRNNLSEHTYSNVPRSTFYTQEQTDRSSSNDEHSKDREKDIGTETTSDKENKLEANQQAPDKENQPGASPAIGRSKTPSIESQSYISPSSEFRSKTPTAEMMSHMARGDANHSNRPPFMDIYNSGRMGERDVFDRGLPDSFTRPSYGYESRSDYPMHMGSPTRREVPSREFCENERFNKVAPPPARSRTPGPELMHGHDGEQYSRHAADIRNKAVAPSASTISGTPNFIPASLYQMPQPATTNRSQPHQNSQYSASSRSSDGNRNHMDSSAQSFNNRDISSSSSQGPVSSLSSYTNSPNLSTPGRSYSTGRPVSPSMEYSNLRKQSTSFEHEEPVASNLTRLHKWTESPSGSLERRTSPLLRTKDRPVEFTVVLRRQENGFGFRIVGGTEEGSQVSVGYIVPGGAADMDGRLQPGDEILYVDGQCVIGASHRKVVQIMGNASSTGLMTLGVRRGYTPALLTESAYREPRDGYPYDITVTRNENEGFGFVIISSVTRAGSVIGKIIDGSPAERCGGLHVGDRILAVNGTDINHMHHEEIVNLIKLSGYSVTLTIGHPQADDTSSTGSNPPVIRSSQGPAVNTLAYPTQSDSDLSRRSDYSPYPSPGYLAATKYNNKYPYQPVLDKQRDIQRQRVTSTQVKPEAEEDKYIVVELQRGSRGFGFSIRGGKEFNNMPLYVLRIADGGTADLDNRLKVGDQIIEINDYNTNNMTHSEAIDLIASGGSVVKLLVKRTGKPPPNVASSAPPGGQVVRSPASNPSPLPSMPNGPVRTLAQGSPGQLSAGLGRIDTKSPYLYNSSGQYENNLGPGRPNTGY